MAKEIRTEIIISASKEKIWAVLTDFENYQKWNPWVLSLNGNVKVGNTIKVCLKGGMTFKPKILTYEKNNELSWLGHFLFKGLFDGAHKFELIDNNNGTTTFRHSEIFKGILVPIFKKQLDIDTKNGFHEMNKKLKEIAERLNTNASML